MTLNQIKDGQYVQDTGNGAYYYRKRNQIYELHPTALIWLSRAILFSESCSIRVKELTQLEILLLPQWEV